MNSSYLLLVLILYHMIGFSLNYPEEDAKSVKHLIVEEGFPFETHFVETEDGYILEMHRIPGSRRNGGTDRGKYPILVRHGLAECSALYLLGGAERSLAMVLADNGYDVWLGNSRGSRYSRKHTKWEADSFGFWNFSFHEVGLYDDSAMVDYILDKTEQEKLFYICHSQSCGELYVLVSLKPEYNDKFHIAVNLAPAVFVGNLTGLARLGADIIYPFFYLFESVGHVNMLDGSSWLRVITNFFCSKGMITQPICMIVIFLIAGFTPYEQDTNIFENFLTYFPSGGSTKQLLHFAMGKFSPAQFRHYDYGTTTNQMVYHTSFAPKYHLEKATLPVAVFYGSSDFLTAAPDVEMLIQILPRVVSSHLVDGFNHFDFLTGYNARNKVYQVALQIMEPYKNK